MSQEGYDRLRAQIKELEEVERPEVIRQIAEAREKGDLSENAEYDAAKEAQGKLETKIAELKAILADTKILDPSKLTKKDEVQILSKVELKNVENGMKLTYTIVSEGEANLLGRKAQLRIGEVHIFLALHRDEMDMSVRHFKSQHSLSHLHAWERSLDGNSHFLGKHLETSQFVIVHIEDVIHLTTWDDQCVTLHERIDVEECIKLLVLSTLVGRNLPCCNLSKNTHDYPKLMLIISNFITPRGTVTSATSPTFLPRSPCAIGVLMEILFSRRLASPSLTMV